MTRKAITNRRRVGLGLLLFGTALLSVPTTMFAQGTTAIAGGGFRIIHIISQTSQFSTEFDATPTNTNDAGVGFAGNPFLGFAGTSTFVRFNQNGKIDARNGGAFAAA